MTFEEALLAASEGDLAKAMHFFAEDDQPRFTLALKYADHVTFHDDGGMPTTSLRRDFVLSYRGDALVAWWEEYEGYYGGGYTGWWIENVDADGPPDGLKALIEALGIALPEISVPRPPISDEHEEH